MNKFVIDLLILSKKKSLLEYIEMFAINIKNFKKTKILYMLFTVSVVMNMKTYLKKKNQLKYKKFLL